MRVRVWRGEAAGDARGGALWRSVRVLRASSLRCLNGNKLAGPLSAAFGRSRNSSRDSGNFGGNFFAHRGDFVRAARRLLSRQPRGARSCGPPRHEAELGLRSGAGRSTWDERCRSFLAASRATWCRNELGPRPACCCPPSRPVPSLTCPRGLEPQICPAQTRP